MNNRTNQQSHGNAFGHLSLADAQLERVINTIPDAVVIAGDGSRDRKMYSALHHPIRNA